MARPRNTEQRRDQIVRGLVPVLARHGWEGASVARIARAARLAPGLVHYHFRDKREILLETIAHLEARAAQRIRRRQAAAGADPVARLEAFVDAMLATGRDADPEAVACWVAFAAEAARDVRVRSALEGTLRRGAARLEPLFVEALGARGRPPAGARAAAAAVVSAVMGALVVAASAPGLIPEGTACATVRTLARALAGADGGAP